MTIFVVKVGDCMQLSTGLEVLIDYFKKYDLKYFILDKKIYNLHPSWYKLKAFDYIDDDFIVSWDIDLLPKKNAPNILPQLNFNKINLALDTGVTLGKIEALKKFSYFKYNCGLMGIPKKYKTFCENIFKYSSNKIPVPGNINPFPNEQDIINKELSKNNYSDVHEIDTRFNTLYYTCKGNIKNLLNSFFIHYTAYNLDFKTRNTLIQKHYNTYFKK